MIKKYGDAQKINVVRHPDRVVKKGSDDMEQQILKFQNDEDNKKHIKTER